jgi:mRNA interferase RelE/StbE
MNYRIEYTSEAEEDYKKFNRHQQYQIDKVIDRVAKNPLPQNEGGYGKPLGNKQGRNLTGLCKITIKKLGIRVVYKLIRTKTSMKIIVIAARADEEVYEIAAERN